MTSRGVEEFWRLYRKLPPEVQTAARKTHRIFSENPSHPGLRLERLKADPRAWSVRITRDYRAVALRAGDNWVWLWIGTHREFDRKFPA